MLRNIAKRYVYRPKIQFRKNKKAILQRLEIENKEPLPYEEPTYLKLKRDIDQEEIEVINQGGLAPKVHWKKISLQ